MAFEYLKLIALSLKFLLPYSLELVREHWHSFIHSYTYKAVASPKHVVVIGGSWAGIELARRLCRSLPTRYRVILVGKNSHFNYTFNFPRYSVLEGHEKLAFIPYDGISKGAPKGVFQHVRGEVVKVCGDEVLLASGERIPYAYRVIATGSTQQPPAKLQSSENDEACGELRSFQQKIKEANKVAVIGGGAVDGYVVAFTPGPSPRFGPRLHGCVLAALEELGVNVVLNVRPEVVIVEESKDQALRFDDGHVETFDLVIPCTGQVPNSGLIATLLPDAVSDSTRCILVEPTLQIADPKHANTFAIGDVAETGGPAMARAAFFQASAVEKNILAMMSGRKPNYGYKPMRAIEGSLKLTLGKSNWLMWCQSDNGEEIIIRGKRGKDDLEVEKWWKYHGADVSSVRRGM